MLWRGTLCPPRFFYLFFHFFLRVRRRKRDSYSSILCLTWLRLDSSERADFSSGTDHERANSVPRVAVARVLCQLFSLSAQFRFTVLKFTGSQSKCFRAFQIIDLPQLSNCLTHVGRSPPMLSLRGPATPVRLHKNWKNVSCSPRHPPTFDVFRPRQRTLRKPEEQKHAGQDSNGKNRNIVRPPRSTPRKNSSKNHKSFLKKASQSISPWDLSCSVPPGAGLFPRWTVLSLPRFTLVSVSSSLPPSGWRIR